MALPQTIDLPAALQLEVLSNHLHLRHTTATRLARTGKLPGAFKVGGTWYVSEAAARALLGGTHVPPGPINK